MAKRLVKWSLDGSILKMQKSLEDPKATAEIIGEFDLSELFPEFTEMNDVQKQVVAYGVKQRLSDKGADAIGDLPGKVTAAKARFQEMLNGKWTGERANATGAKENREIAKQVKSALAEGMTLNGLMAKKLTGKVLTPEEEAKFLEFVQIATAHEKKGKK